MKTKTDKLHVFSENIYSDWELDEKKFINIAKKYISFMSQMSMFIMLPA